MSGGWKWVAVAALTAVLAAPVPAQRGGRKEQPQRSVQGLVTDQLENPLAKAVVQLKNTKTLQVRSFYSDEQGKYRFHGLDLDLDYEIRAEFGKAVAGPRTVSSFDSRREVIINFKLDVKQ